MEGVRGVSRPLLDVSHAAAELLELLNGEALNVERLALRFDLDKDAVDDSIPKLPTVFYEPPFHGIRLEHWKKNGCERQIGEYRVMCRIGKPSETNWLTS